MELFSKSELRTYLSKNVEKLKNEVNEISDSTIMTCDIQEWVDYLISKYEIPVIQLFEENILQSIDETKIKEYNPFSRSFPFEKEFYEIDGYKITFKIPFDGDDNLLYLQPNTRLFANYEVENVTKPYKDNCGYFWIALDFKKQELLDKNNDMQKYVLTKFNNEFNHYKTMIGYVNHDVNEFNNYLPKLAKECLEKRKEKASIFASISEMLEIPLKKNDNAPNSVPVTLKRINRTPLAKPQQRNLPNEYSISDADYQNINNIIMMAGTTMEKTARTYFGNNEEELRDHLLATLNTHYDNATGETFRKIGKTDIHIEFENKAAFIGECKIWHGEKLFADAIQQVMNYSTWKDNKITVIIFNKENKAFNPIVEKIDEWVKNNTKSYKKSKHNMWICDYYRTDMNELINITIMAFDLYVDSSQFKDIRLR